MTLQEMASAKAQDLVLQAVRNALCTNQWYKSILNYQVSIAEQSHYERIMDELTWQGTMLLKGHHIVLPTTPLHEKGVNTVDEGHQGIHKTNAIMRENVWFPYMDRLIDQKVKSCLPCQIASPPDYPGTAGDVCITPSSVPGKSQIIRHSSSTTLERIRRKISIHSQCNHCMTISRQTSPGVHTMTDRLV